MTGRLDDEGRLVEQVARACSRAQDPLALLERVASLVRRRVPYAAAGWLLVDPDTMLLNAAFNEDTPRAAHLELIQCELEAEDVNKFVDVARSPVPAASLSGATGGDLGRSARWSKVYGPRGYGDELRGMFRSGAAVWGHVCMTRWADDPWFTPAEVALVARLGPHVGNGIRTSLLLAGAPDTVADAAPALVVLTDDGEVESMSALAQAWLGPLDDERLQSTIVLHEVARQARLLDEGDASGPPALARVWTRAVGWIVVRAARIDDASGGAGRTAVVLEQARRSDVAPILLHAHRLTPREQEVARLMLSGVSTEEAAAELWITTETLRGHVKSLFAKLGVRSRPELVALLSHEPAVPTARSER
ncbi:MAG TPA: helix-turn-helix transcriptional regulator [Marmoricola sp.]|nr:helix-turn-helix transcriptional regulator [Marmoricola sp.]